jgi:pimeloyl-ACP methyl ester carboxylesterase
MNLPDRTRPRLASPPARRAGVAGAALWRLLHPRGREPYTEAPAPPPARRLYYTAPDGWSAPLFRAEPLPDAPGEPVVVVHGVGLGPDAWRYGGGSLSARLVEAGFAPFLATVRTSREAIEPTPGARREVRVEDVVAQDLPAALDSIAADSGYPRVHLVAHGLAGVLALAAASRRPAALASLAVLGAPLRFPRGGSGARVSHRLTQLLPGDAEIPLRALLRLGVWLDPELLGWSGAVPAPRVRGVARCAGEDLPSPWVRTVARWWRDGAASLHDGLVDVEGPLSDAEVPLLVVTAAGDVVCPPEAGEAALGAWGHPDRAAARVDGAHLDLVLGAGAGDALVPWLTSRRRLAWGERAA